jgi:hypothetical protein
LEILGDCNQTGEKNARRIVEKGSNLPLLERGVTEIKPENFVIDNIFRLG